MLAARIHNQRKTKGLTQHELETAAGLPPTAVSKIEANVRAVSAEEAIQLAAALEMPIQTLLCGIPEDDLASVLVKAHLAGSVAARRDMIRLLRGLADALEGSLGEGSGPKAPAPPVPAKERQGPWAARTTPLRSVAAKLSAHLLICVSLCCALAVFLIDIRVPMGGIEGIPYVLILVLASDGVPRRGLVALTLVCSGLTALGILSPPGAPLWMDILNRSLTLVTLWVTLWCLRRFGGILVPQAA